MRSKHPFSYKHVGKKHQSGFSVVELLIAGLLGLVLIGGVVQLFLSSNQSYRSQDDLATLQENGRFALMFLKDQIQMGGYITGLSSNPVIPVTFGVGGSTDGALGTPDSITVSYEGDIAAGENIDCTGIAVPSGIITNTLSISDNQLMCQGNGAGSTAQPLIDGVENFQVLYGVEDFVAGVLPGCRVGVVNRYLNATQVIAQGLQERILSVRVSLLLASDNDVLPETETLEYQLLDQSIEAKDRLARRVFQQTIFMPNAIHAAASNPDAVKDCAREYTPPATP